MTPVRIGFVRCYKVVATIVQTISYLFLSAFEASVFIFLKVPFKTTPKIERNHRE